VGLKIIRPAAMPNEFLIKQENTFMGGLLSKSNMQCVGLTLLAIIAINKFVPATRNPLK
jgi:hypothetical protein